MYKIAQVEVNISLSYMHYLGIINKARSWEGV